METAASEDARVGGECGGKVLVYDMSYGDGFDGPAAGPGEPDDLGPGEPGGIGPGAPELFAGPGEPSTLGPGVPVASSARPGEPSSTGPGVPPLDGSSHGMEVTKVH